MSPGTTSPAASPASPQAPVAREGDAHPLMVRALELARSARQTPPPNPSVGCVIASTRGDILGEGHTQAVGGPHAEVMALRDAQARGHDVRGATAWVTLEPCSHQGRTGPCCDALIQAGIGRVEASLADPNPLVGGRGFERLRAAGIQVSVGMLAQAARELNIGFFSRMVRAVPWVRLKCAVSLDGRTALADGRSQWITGEAARADGHLWRARACAVMTGSGTLLRDNPRLDARAPGVVRHPHRIIVDSHLRTPVDAAVFGAPGQVWIYTASADERAAAALRERGATISHMPDAQGRVDLSALMADLARREVNELHVEAGQALNGALLNAGLVDEMLVYMAARLLGDGLPLAQVGPLPSLEDSPRLRWHSVDPVGEDLRLIARFAGRGAF